MKITKITKKGKLYQIQFGNQQIELKEDTILFFRLTKDKEINESDLKIILEKNEYYSVYGKVLRKIKTPKSTYEIRRYLETLEVNEVEIKKIIEELSTKKLINDEQLIKNIIEFTNKSKQQIRLKLIQKGFSESEYIELLSLKNEEEQLKNDFLKLVKKNQKESKRVAIKKITQSLLTKGYSYSKIEKVLNEIDSYQFNNFKIKSDIEKYQRKYNDDNKVIKKLLTLGYSYSEIKENL